GKTKTVSHFVAALLSQPQEYKDVGVIICLGRLEEIKDQVKALDIHSDKLCILTNQRNLTLNSLGSTSANEAQILITTQQRLETRLQGRLFEQDKSFFYQDRARQVRIWDETFLPGQPITLNVRELGLLFK